MEALFSIVIGILVACGVYLVLRARTFPVVLGLTLISYGVNVFLFATFLLNALVKRVNLLGLTLHRNQ